MIQLIQFLTGKKPTLEEEALQEAELLDRDMLERELQMIESHYKVEAQKRKKQFLLDWLSRDTPRNVHNHE